MMQKLNVNGITYAYTIHQQKASLPHLLMFHGFMGDSRTFGHLLDKLVAFCNPVTIDLLGHGQSEKVYEASRYQEEKQIADLKEVTSSIFEGPPFLYGYSMGGRLALKMAGTAPELLKGLILESANPGIWDDEKRSQRREADLNRAKEIEQNYLAFLERWEELPLFQSPAGVEPLLTETYHRIHREQNPGAMGASLRGFGTGFMEPVTAGNLNYKGHVMLLAGSADPKYIAINKKMENFFDEASNIIIPAGHRVHLDNPEIFIKQIQIFVQQNS